MSLDKMDGRTDGSEDRRLVQLTEARRLLASALTLLDEHARSQAAATVDMAMHLVDRELSE